MRNAILIAVLAAVFAGGGAGVALAVSGDSSTSTPTPAVAAASGQEQGGGMMTGYGSTETPSPVSTIPAATARAQAFAATVGLHTGEVMHFERNFYVALLDAEGNSATEVLVDPATGYVRLEYGPAMMWNTTYGMMSGQVAGALMSRAGAMMGSSMMGGSMMGGTTTTGGGGMMGGSNGAGQGWLGPTAPAKSPAKSPAGAVSIADARLLAQAWLDANQPGVKVETSGGDAFPGYFTLETMKDEKIVGMTSVNARTGAVWPHWWHGAFVTMTK